MDEIAKQAHQGSVAAIVQIMNDRLADMGVRTRAVLEKGILQVLCEAQESEQLEQSVLIPHLREILEAIAPRTLRRVNICSRIAREQQLVWLEDIHRNPENVVLWSQEIILRKAGIWQKLFPPQGDRQANSPAQSALRSMPPTPELQPSKMRNILGMVGLCTISFLAGLAYNNWQNQHLDWSQLAEFIPFSNSSPSSVAPAAPIPQPTVSPASQANSPPPASAANANSTPSPAPAQTTNPTAVLLPAPNTSAPLAPAKDPFAEAVRLAEAVSLQGQTAQTEAEWLNLSTQWKQASELMKAVSASDPRYSTARDRVVFYQKNSEVALARAKEQQK